MSEFINLEFPLATANKANGFDEVSAEMKSFFDLSFTTSESVTAVDSPTFAAPTPVLLPFSAPPAYFANAFSVQQELDKVLDSPLGLSPLTLTASPFDLNSPLLSSAFGTPDLEEGFNPELDFYPSLFGGDETQTGLDWTSSSMTSSECAVPASTPLETPSSLPSIKPVRLAQTQQERDEEDAASRAKVKDRFTGTRNTKKPMVGMTEPTRPVNYFTPSATSRKRAPAAVVSKLLAGATPANKKARTRREVSESPALPQTCPDGLDPNELPDELLSAIELKRRQNTLAARRSRIRKQGHLQELQGQIETLQGEVSDYKEKCAQLELLVSQLRGC